MQKTVRKQKYFDRNLPNFEKDYKNSVKKNSVKKDQFRLFWTRTKN